MRQDQSRSAQIVRVTICPRGGMHVELDAGSSFKLPMDDAAAALRRDGADRIEVVRYSTTPERLVESRCEALARAAGFEVNRYALATPTSMAGHRYVLVRTVDLQQAAA